LQPRPGQPSVSRISAPLRAWARLVAGSGRASPRPLIAGFAEFAEVTYGECRILPVVDQDRLKTCKWPLFQTPPPPSTEYQCTFWAPAWTPAEVIGPPRPSSCGQPIKTTGVCQDHTIPGADKPTARKHRRRVSSPGGTAIFEFPSSLPRGPAFDKKL